VKTKVQKWRSSFFLILLFSIQVLTAQAQLSDQAEISLITCRPGDEIYNAFGHTGIRINDPVYRIDLVFNYGMFSFSEPDFVPKFLRGKLMYWLGTENYKDFLNNYSNQRRSVFEQNLQLGYEERNTVFYALQNNLRKENRRYLYDFFFDNCSTRPRDVFFHNLESLQIDSSDTEQMSFRQMLDVYTSARPWADFGIDLIIGSKADREAHIKDQMFLPEFLMLHLSKTRLDGHALVESTTLSLDYEEDARQRDKDKWFSPSLLFSLFLLLELILFLRPGWFSSKTIKVYDALWWTLMSLCGLILLFMWLGTDHEATKQNMNTLWMHPFYVLLFKKRNRKLYIFFALFLILALLQQFFLQSLHIASMLIILCLFIKLMRHLNNS